MRSGEPPVAGMPAFDLRLIRSFVVVAETLHFGRAAELLLLAQPALSRQVASLEHQLGTLLLVRSSREVTLTEAGVLALAAGREILELARRAQLAVRPDHDLTGVLRVHYRYTDHNPAMRRAISSFTAANPRTSVFITDGGTMQTEEAILAGRVDLGVIFGDRAPPGMSYLPLTDAEFGVYCSVRRRFVRRGSARWSDLDGMRLFVPAPGLADEYDAWLRANLARAAVTVTDVTVAVPNASLVLGSLVAGEAVAVLGEAHIPRVDGLAWVPFETPEFVQYGLFWPPESDNRLIGPFTRWVTTEGLSSALVADLEASPRD